MERKGSRLFCFTLCSLFVLLNRMRCVSIHVIVAVIVCGIALSAAGIVHAQNLDISNPSMEWYWNETEHDWEASYDFGDVALGESKTATFLLESIGSSEVAVYLLQLTDTPTTSPGPPYFPPNPCSGSFCFNMDTFPSLPNILAPGKYLMLDVIFTPLSLGEQNAYLYIRSNDTYPPPGVIIFISFVGTGVNAPSPEEQIENIQEFFDDAVTSGELVGVGARETAAAGKLNALENMLEQAEYFIDSGFILKACDQLNSIYRKTDGAPLPRDFVSGSAAAELAAKVLELMESLGCE